jgi:UDP-N-acetylglucosamine 4,6-dehydratase/5-epimerase
MFKNKSILITGGTGSFGQKFVKTLISKHKTKKIIIFSRDELKQFNMLNDFKQFEHKLRFFLGDVRDFERINFALKDVDYVVHAAALKQVPAAEYNPSEFIKTNVLGAENIYRASIQNNVKKVIALSTDKAASPINLYGASKLMSDKIFISANNFVGSGSTRFSVVRYGNVVNSRGSVLPYFRELIKNKSKFFPITDLDMTRFFITLQQGVDFVINSFKRMHGAEIFVPKIPSIKIVDLALALDPTKKIKIIGIRPGEKIHEVMCPKDDYLNIIEFKDHFIIKPSIKIIDQKINFKINKLKEKGAAVKKNFEFNSLNNNHYLSKNQIIKIYKEN